RRMLLHFRTLLEAMPGEPDRMLGQLEMLPERERRQVLGEARDGRADAVPAIRYAYPRSTVHELLAEQAARRPDAIAVQLENRAVTYAELDQRADVLAARLRSFGIEC